MPEYLAPGVYVEEVGIRSKSIEGVGTSTAAFVGPAHQGPLGATPVQVTSFTEFERIFGGRENLNFAGSPLIDSITIQMDNSQYGGVFAPSAILIDNISRSFTAPPQFTVGSVSFTGLGLVGNTHTIQFYQANNAWTFVSEISFAGAVPEPETYAMLLAGLGLLGSVARRRKLKAT